MKSISFAEIKKNIEKIKFEKFDLIVGIARGGIIPASLISTHTNTDLRILWINFRDDSHAPRYSSPKLIKKSNFSCKGKKILIVDDVSRTGATIKKAKEILNAKKAKTFLISGKGDYSLYNFKECVKFPWS